jgi:RluA family pseudouridine synthase
MTMPVSDLPRLVLFEDEHLLVVNKPAGMNTHAPAPFAGEGLYDWLRHREPRWANLAIIHRLDKETSGVMIFARSPEANRSLTAQFAGHDVQKVYHLITDRVVPRRHIRAVSALVRTGDKYVSRPLHAGSQPAETHFRVIGTREGLTTVEAKPVTGRTHQIRVHAPSMVFPFWATSFTAYIGRARFPSRM